MMVYGDVEVRHRVLLSFEIIDSRLRHFPTAFIPLQIMSPFVSPEFLLIRTDIC
jgi:hypothetical protein